MDRLREKAGGGLDDAVAEGASGVVDGGGETDGTVEVVGACPDAVVVVIVTDVDDGGKGQILNPGSTCVRSDMVGIVLGDARSIVRATSMAWSG